MFNNRICFSNDLNDGHIWRRNGEPYCREAVNIFFQSVTFPTKNELPKNRLTLCPQRTRVITIALKSKGYLEYSPSIADCRLTCLGLSVLPIAESIKNDIAVCNRAGIRVVMITATTGYCLLLKNKISAVKINYAGDLLNNMSDDHRDSKERFNIFKLCLSIKQVL